jgi:hypothetical protein
VIVFAVLTAIWSTALFEFTSRSRWASFLSLALIIALYSLRWETGTDWGSYFEFFDSFNSSDRFLVVFEPGYILLVKLVKSIWNNYSFYLLVHSALVWIFIWEVNKRLSPRPIISLVLVLCYFYPYLGSERQLIAIAFCWISLIFVISREPIKFYTSLAVAVSFHVSAVIFLPVYLISRPKFGKSTLALLGLFSVIVLSLDIFAPLMAVLEASTSMLGKDYGSYSENISAQSFYTTGLLKKIAVISLIIIFDKQLSREAFYRQYLIVRNIILYGFVLHALFGSSIPTFVGRASLYFNPFECILFTFILASIKSLIPRTIFCCLLIGYSYIYLYRSLQIYYDLFFPYCSVFETACRANIY